MKNKKIIGLTALSLLVIGIVVGLAVESKTGVLHNLTTPAIDSTVSMWGDDFSLAEIKSPVDGELQKAYFYVSRSDKPQPLIVSLHSWSFDYTQYDTLAILSKEKDINYIHPNFRGHNWTKNACCSELALSDIDVSIDYAIAHANVDTSRIYVIGRSGGGYTTISLFMKSRHKIKKFAAWVPLTDLITWYDETKIRKLTYPDNILVCTHSTDGKLNKEIAVQKSPIYWPTSKEKLNYSTLEIFTGIYDGLEGNGPIPITQSINFYNKVLGDLAVVDSSQYVSDYEKLQLLERRKPLSNLGSIGNRKVCLRKESGNVSITIFTAGHEMLSEFAFSDLIK